MDTTAFSPTDPTYPSRSDSTSIDATTTAITAVTLLDACDCCANLPDTADSPEAASPAAQYDEKTEDKESDALAVCYTGCSACCHTFQHKHCTRHSHTAPKPECCKAHTAPTAHIHTHTAKAYFLRLPTAAIAPFDVASPTHCIEAAAASAALSSSQQTLPRLPWMDRLLSVWIVGCMVLGVLIGYFDPGAADTINGWGGADGTSYPIAAGLIVMMYPPLARVRYDRIWLLLTRRLRRRRAADGSAATPRPLLATSSSSQLGAETSPTAAAFSSSPNAASARSSVSARLHSFIAGHHFSSMLSLSLVINWLIGPLLMFFLAVACLPDKPHLIRGLIFVGVARCIAMVVVWNQLALGSEEYVCILVVLNSLFQIVMYSPYVYFFVSVFLPALNLPSMSGGDWDNGDSTHVSFVLIVKSVAIYLGIPFVAGLSSWLLIPRLTGRDWYNRVWVKYTSPLTLFALCFTIIVLFVLRGHTIATSIVAILRICVPLVAYFTITFSATLLACYRLGFSYPDTVSQCFTAASNNFELAIAVSIASFGVASDESLACVIGPLIEVPAMLLCVSVMRYSRRWFDVTRWESAIEKEDRLEKEERHSERRGQGDGRLEAVRAATVGG